VPYRHKKLTFAISSPDEFLFKNLEDRHRHMRQLCTCSNVAAPGGLHSPDTHTALLLDPTGGRPSPRLPTFDPHSQKKLSNAALAANGQLNLSEGFSWFGLWRLLKTDNYKSDTYQLDYNAVVELRDEY